MWISRCFDSVYSVAITERAVYIGGHFQFNESPTASDPWPGLDNVGYGTGQGLSGYGLGDDVVRREHLGLLDYRETGELYRRCDVGMVGYQMTLLVERAGAALSPALVAELKESVLR